VPFYPFFWHISETVRATSPHMSRKVERNEDFEKNTLVWRDLTAFITAFCDFVSSTMDVYEAISTHIDGGRGQDDVTSLGPRVRESGLARLDQYIPSA